MKKVVAICFMVCLVVVGIFAWMKTERNVEFEYVTGFLANVERRYMDYFWFPINDELPLDLRTDYVYNLGGEDIDWDFSKYTYVVCCGYELEQLSYNYWDVWGKLSKVKTFHGRVILKNDSVQDRINIYRIKRMLISNDIHDRDTRYRIIIEE